MPPVANPNPGRARRSDSATEAALATAVVATVQAEAVEDPAAALALAPAAAVAAPPRPGAGVFGLMPARQTGLMMQQAPERKRSATPQRDDPAWKCVTILDDANKLQPRWQCLGCGAQRTGGATKISDHLLGRSGSSQCVGSSDVSFINAVATLRDSEAGKAAKKAQKQAVVAVNHAAVTVGSQSRMLQPELSFMTSLGDACDAAIADFFFSCNISGAVAEHPKFKRMLNVLRTAPASYNGPNRKKLYGPLLDESVDRLRRETAPLREAIVQNGATIISDGWDSVTRDHLVNCLYGNASCLLFDGTVQLTSDDAESADFVAELLRQCMERNGRLAFVQVCTDTCSVMKAAWKLLLKEYPWLTATCCATHVLSLELHDLGKLPDVASIILKVCHIAIPQRIGFATPSSFAAALATVPPAPSHPRWALCSLCSGGGVAGLARSCARPLPRTTGASSACTVPRPLVLRGSSARCSACSA